RPFVGTTFFTHGVSFANIERFEFTKEFAQAYYDSKGKDVQHTFAIFRGDAYTYGNSTITPVYSAPSNVSVRASITNAINSPFTRGSYVY
ncbi:hypothetical protein, partial [Salmonella enterica]|uniref:hypothetical protein n=1 Tax=Salmonella enterica TaxID=28901 RepID=UPI003D2E6B61